jgi:hypothetical protein
MPELGDQEDVGLRFADDLVCDVDVAAIVRNGSPAARRPIVPHRPSAALIGRAFEALERIGELQVAR